jgi:hypothetical protein
MVISAAAPAMLASKTFFISHPTARVYHPQSLPRQKGMIGKSMGSDENFGSVLHRCHTTNSRGY